MINADNRFKVEGTRYKVEGTRYKVKHFPFPLSPFPFLFILLLVSVITWGLFYGMIAEVDLRELKANKMEYNRVLTDRAMAQYYAERQWTR